MFCIENTWNGSHHFIKLKFNEELFKLHTRKKKPQTQTKPYIEIKLYTNTN